MRFQPQEREATKGYKRANKRDWMVNLTVKGGCRVGTPVPRKAPNERKQDGSQATTRIKDEKVEWKETSVTNCASGDGRG